MIDLTIIELVERSEFQCKQIRLEIYAGLQKAKRTCTTDSVKELTIKSFTHMKP